MPKPYNPAAIKARELLVHYFETAFKAAGLKWTAENAAEVESIIEWTIDAAEHHAREPA